MTDVFISYAREDRERARVLASALEARGWSAWWDREIVPGQSFDQVIERELERAKSVVVLWSGHSIASEWVKNEAAVGAERGVLVPALIESVKLPLEFRHKQAANLVGWSGSPSDEGFQSLCHGIAAAIPGMKVPQPPPSPPSPPRWLPWSRRWALAAMVAILAMGFGTYYWLGTRPPPRPPEPAPRQSGPREEIYRRLAAAQWKGVQMLTQGQPDALARIDETLRDADEAIGAFPDDARFHEVKGYLLKDVYQSPTTRRLLPNEKRREYLSRARASAEQAVRLNPNSASAHNLMGNVLYFEGKCDAAIREYNIALGLNRDDNYKGVIEGDKALAVRARDSRTCSGR